VTYLIAYDGTDLAETALERARSLATAMEEDLVVATVVPESTDYALEHGWIDAGEPFSVEAVVGALEGRVAETAPDATFEYRRVGRHAQPGTIASKLREMARGVEADTVFVGSENAGRVVVPLTSVAGSVASGDYDVYVVR
jgi:nucleotide-binding universal stress UspA family protein